MPIIRIIHEQEKPYTLVLKNVINDSSISPNCRWLSILCESLGKKPSYSELIDNLKDHMSREEIFDLLNEYTEMSSQFLKEEGVK